jgi:hypothetical protein
MLHVGLDLSRTRLDVHVIDEAGAPVLVTTAAPDSGGLAAPAHRVGEFAQPVTAAIESMTSARFIHDQLELRGWEVEIADAVKVKGLHRWPPRPTRSTLGCWPSSRDGSWCRPSGYGIRRCAPSGSAPAGGCIWCTTGPR